MTFRKTIPSDSGDKFAVSANGVDFLKPDRALRKFSWEDAGETFRTGDPGRARDVHKRLAVANRKVKLT